MHACNNVILFILQKTRSIILNWIIYVKNQAWFGERNNLLDLCPIWKDGKELYQISFHLNVHSFIYSCWMCTVFCAKDAILERRDEKSKNLIYIFSNIWYLNMSVKLLWFHLCYNKKHTKTKYQNVKDVFNSDTSVSRQKSTVGNTSHSTSTSHSYCVVC